MVVCPPFDPLERYVGSLVAWVDCRTLGLGEDAFRALGPGSPFGMALTGLLTIYVALIGYRLLLGGAMTVREGMFAALKIGLVLALATQWPAWRVLVYDVATKTPEAAAAGFLRSSGLSNGGSEMIAARVDGVSAALAQMVSASAEAKAKVAPAGSQSPAPAPPPAPGTLPDAAATSVNAAIGTLVASALAGLAGVRIVMGFLLAIGPLLLACLLFEASRGLFMGWLRAVAGTFFAALAVPAALALQLGIIEPQVRALQALLAAAQPVGALPQQIHGTATVFALCLLAVLAAAASIGLGLAWPLRQPAGWLQGLLQPALPAAEYLPGRVEPGQSRSRQIAAAATALSLRQERQDDGLLAPRRRVQPHPAAQDRNFEPQFAVMPLGQTGRRTLQRQSLGARRRDDLI